MSTTEKTKEEERGDDGRRKERREIAYTLPETYTHTHTNQNIWEHMYTDAQHIDINNDNK